MRSLGPLAVACGIAMSIVPGCSKRSDCDALAETANRRTAEFARLQARQSDTPTSIASDMESAAALAERTAVELEALQLSHEAVSSQATQYAEAARELSEAAQTMSTRMQALAQLRADETSAKAAFEKQGKALLDACSTASMSCNAVGDVLRAQPKTPTANELPKVLADYADALDALDVDDTTVQDAVDARVSATKSYTEVLERKAPVLAALQKARETLQAALTRQNQLVDALNAYCVGTD